MFLKSVIGKLKMNSGGEFSLPSSLLKLLGVIIAPAVFLAISGRSPNRISWYFLVLAMPFFMVSLLLGFLKFTRKPVKDLSIS
jgi:hypothetical protein